jgi:hypothetical protein
MAQGTRAARRTDDEELLDRLARALEAGDPPPASLAASARELLAWRTVDLELAALLGEGPAHARTSTD